MPLDIPKMSWSITFSYPHRLARSADELEASWRHRLPRSRPTWNRSPGRESSATHDGARTGWKCLVSWRRTAEPGVQICRSFFQEQVFAKSKEKQPFNRRPPHVNFWYRLPHILKTVTKVVLISQPRIIYAKLIKSKIKKLVKLKTRLLLHNLFSKIPVKDRPVSLTTLNLH